MVLTIFSKNGEQGIDSIFEILEKNIKTLKHQFEEFNIAMDYSFGNKPNQRKYHLLKWKSNIDATSLKKIKAVWKQQDLKQ